LFGRVIPVDKKWVPPTYVPGIIQIVYPPGGFVWAVIEAFIAVIAL
jgi:hypothetical protein